MGTTVTGKLNKPANIFQAGESQGFGIRIGVKCRNPKTKQDEWTNYQAAIFAKSPGQIQFYQQALVEGAVVEITAEQLRVDSYDGQNGQVLSIEMLNARLGYVGTPGQQQGQQQGQHPTPQQQMAQQMRGAPQQQMQPQGYPPQQHHNGVNPQTGKPDLDDGWDDDIPFISLLGQYPKLLHCI